MWMQQSMESSSFGNSHQRNRFGGQSSSGFDSRSGGAPSGGSYMGGGGPSGADNADWKSKILESGQWLGGKVIEYGGKLARGGSHDSIQDHMAHQPRNDGRANWMADIRGSASSFSNNGSYSSGGGSGSTYQNDFVTERPKAYSDTGFSSQSTTQSSYAPKPPAYRDYNNSDSRHNNKKKADKHDTKHSKKSKSKKHSKRREVSSSDESESESEASSEEDSASSSGSESDGKHRRSKAKGKSKSKSKKSQKRRESISSSEEESLEAKPKTKKSVVKPEKAPADYSFSFDPAKLPPPPAEESSSKKSKKDKKGSKSRGRKQSMASSESELSDKENQRTKKVTLKSKSSTKKSSPQATVDLLGVEFDATPVQAPTAVPFGVNNRPPQPDIFSQPLDPLQDLAGLNFSAAYSQPTATPTPVAFGLTPPTPAAQEATAHHATDAQVLKKLLPENSIVDLDSLASDKKKNGSSHVEKKSLNELQREQPSQYQQQQAMLLQQQQQQQQMMLAAGQAPMGHAPLVMQQQQQMNYMQMNHMNSMMQQMHLQGTPQPQQQQMLMQQQAMFAAQAQGFPAPNQKNGMQHFAYAPQ